MEFFRGEEGEPTHDWWRRFSVDSIVGVVKENLKKDLWEWNLILENTGRKRKGWLGTFGSMLHGFGQCWKPKFNPKIGQGR
ncbi:hypothetical protein FRX31_021681 [Thalictrum thalictroides]|uniref:Uncharacterized protein n=1 Tax=Thalictrum thalictroides TaxID=46969 RepID=A0A7J6VV97_THATH|nr:hypothetical protein FRX31_021681 [Thalictrum thalictroides]